MCGPSLLSPSASWPILSETFRHDAPRKKASNLTTLVCDTVPFVLRKEHILIRAHLQGGLFTLQFRLDREAEFLPSIGVEPFARK